uniref:Uncharacterized protein n=1 Tax=Arundo donax TaxID=35708 RepID=A0A0A9BRT8_ARUDO
MSGADRVRCRRKQPGGKARGGREAAPGAPTA